MAFLRSLLFALVFYAGTLVAILLALLASLRGNDAVRAHGLRWARFHGWCCRNLLGIQRRIEGQVPQGAVLIAAKHQSMYETLELVVILSAPVIVLKRELADIPLWGGLARQYGTIAVTREGSAGALRAMLRAAREAMAAGRAIMIFRKALASRRGSIRRSSLASPGFTGSSICRSFRSRLTAAGYGRATAS